MQNHHIKVTLVALALCFATVQVTNAAGPRGGGGGKPAPNPDIAYMSDDNTTDALSQAAVRGIETATGSDVSLMRSKAGRLYQAIAWSPDGKLMAWFEMGLGMVSTPVSIMVGAPKGKASAVYTAAPGDGKTQISTGFDGLAWGTVRCGSSVDSVLVFAGMNPDGIYGIRFVNGSPAGDPTMLMEWQSPPTNTAGVPPGTFAFSPLGQYLVFGGSGYDSSSYKYGLWYINMCTGLPATPALLQSNIGGTWAEGAPIRSIDWSRGGGWLALSVTTGTDLPWRDLKIADVAYSASDGTEPVEVVSTGSKVCTVNLDSDFTTASSEHFPQWAPDDASIAFSQSSDAGRAMYLMGIDTNDCSHGNPTPIGSKWPRALDWK